eukprot:TRINITY_DN10249_c0_g2_i1.p1 TRINITY_DN10249_c0_g2~~TRINITY_DN10249_c0_g2_i1.p1  ORF type:complete len:690 (+),score=133.72 TRINITY_DN10249_c0_g2_i1:65-2134(+)
MAEIERMREKERVEEFHEGLLAETAEEPPPPQTHGIVDYENTMVYKEPVKFSELQQAIQQGDIDTFKSLVPSVFSVDCVLQGVGWGILQQLVCETNTTKGTIPKLVEYVVGLGADVSFTVPSMGLTTLDLCCQNYNNTEFKSDVLEVIKILHTNGADINQCSGPLGLPCIYWSVLNNNWSPELSDLLLSLGTRLDTLNSNKANLFHSFFLTLERVDYREYPEDDVVLHILKSWGENCTSGIFVPDAFGNTPLHYAVRNGACIKAIQYLLEKGADPNITNTGGETPYDWSLLEGGGEYRKKIASYLAPFRAPSLPGHSKLPLDALSYSTWKQIGMGSFGRVYKARYEAIREDVAVKELKNGDTIHYRLQRAEFQHEISELHGSRCKFVLTYFGFAINEESKTLYMVTELCNGSLDKVLQKEGSPPLSRILSITSQIGKALLYLHTGNRCHNDVAARNVLLANDGEMRLGDFGLACRLGDPLPRIAILWSPPEALSTPSHTRTAYSGYDVWSFGVLIWEIFESAKSPYYYIGGNNKELRDHVISGGILRRANGCPEEFWNDVVRKCFEPRDTRPSMEELLETIERYQEMIANGLEDDLSDCASLDTEERLRRALDREKLAKQSGSDRSQVESLASRSSPARLSSSHNSWAYQYSLPGSDEANYFGHEYGATEEDVQKHRQSYYDYDTETTS